MGDNLWTWRRVLLGVLGGLAIAALVGIVAWSVSHSAAEAIAAYNEAHQ